MSNPTVRDLIIAGLKAGGYDGLANPNTANDYN